MLRINRHWPHWPQSVLFCRFANGVERCGLTWSLLDGAGDAVSVSFCVWRVRFEMRSNIIWAGDCIEVRCTCVLMQMGTDCVLTLGTDSVPRLGTDSVPRLGRIAFQNSRISLPVRSKASPKWGRIPSLVSGTKIVPTITKHVLGTKNIPQSQGNTSVKKLGAYDAYK